MKKDLLKTLKLPLTASLAIVIAIQAASIHRASADGDDIDAEDNEIYSELQRSGPQDAARDINDPDKKDEEELQAAASSIAKPITPSASRPASLGISQAEVKRLRLPDEVVLKTPTESFTHNYFFAVREGKVYMKSNPATIAKQGEWQYPEWALVTETGLPHGDKISDEKMEPVAITEISADGLNLAALGKHSDPKKSNTLYYLKLENSGFIPGLKWPAMEWRVIWGLPVIFAGLLQVDPAHDHSTMGTMKSGAYGKEVVPRSPNGGWSMSHRGLLAKYYMDRGGNRKPVVLGVTTVYRRSNDGYHESISDPWWKPNFEHELCTPYRGRFHSVAMSASASTRAYLSENGTLFTQLSDHDVSGANFGASYSWEKGHNYEKQKNRVLPPTPWKKHPKITEGRITDLITLFQTGGGDNGREIRVEGINKEGKIGYFRKQMDDQAWTFVASKEKTPKLKGNLLSKYPKHNATDEELLLPETELNKFGRGLNLTGIMKSNQLDEVVSNKLGDHGVEVKLIGFDPICTPGMIRISLEGEDLWVKLETRELRTTPDGKKGKLNGQIIVSPDTLENATPKFKKMFQHVFGKRRFIDVVVVFNDKKLMIKTDFPFFPIIGLNMLPIKDPFKPNFKMIFDKSTHDISMGELVVRDGYQNELSNVAPESIEQWTKEDLVIAKSTRDYSGSIVDSDGKEIGLAELDAFSKYKGESMMTIKAANGKIHHVPLYYKSLTFPDADKIGVEPYYLDGRFAMHLIDNMKHYLDDTSLTEEQRDDAIENIVKGDLADIIKARHIKNGKWQKGDRLIKANVTVSPDSSEITIELKNGVTFKMKATEGVNGRKRLRRVS